ncbi:MAG TPA: hypothetical protein VFV78_15030 [Vicinamibacterales bacterium]|nr:hypothetical protein [Vicinamibacterales bacterium]
MKTILLIAAIIVLTTAFARGAAPVARFTANALNVGGDQGPVATLVQIDIDRWSTEDEHDKLAGPLATNRQMEASNILRDLPRIGAIRALDLAGDPIYYARTTTTPDRHEHIMAIAIRPLRAFERLITVNMSAYPFSVIELDVDASGRGTGTIALGATLTAGPEKPLQAAPDRLVERVRLTSVKRAK